MNTGAGDWRDAKRRASLRRVQRLAFWLDDAIAVPGTRLRIGLDGLIGLVPFAGDAAGFGLSMILVAEAMRLGAPRRVWRRMIARAALDYALGLCPLFGDLLDFAYKANRRNLDALTAWLDEAVSPPAPRRARAWPWLLGAGSVLILLAAVLWRAVFA